MRVLGYHKFRTILLMLQNAKYFGFLIFLYKIIYYEIVTRYLQFNSFKMKKGYL